MPEDVAVLTVRLVLAALFAVAGAGKLMDLSGARSAVRAFGGPVRLAGPAAAALGGCELAIAAGLGVNATAWEAALAAAGLLALLTLVVARSLLRGERPPCHCFGRLHAARIGPGTLARNLLLWAAASAVVAHGRADGGPSATRWVAHLGEASAVALVAGVAGAVALLAVGWLVTELLGRNGRLLARVDQLEQALAGAGVAVPAPAIDQAVGAAVLPGQRAPAFELPVLDAGGSVGLPELLGSATGVVLVFASASCRPCRVVLRRLADWGSGDGEGAGVVVIGEGDESAWRSLPAEMRPPRVLLQPEREVAEVYGATVTPAAVAISADGTVASPPALGASAVLALLAGAAGARGPVQAPSIVEPPSPLVVRLADEGALR